MDNFIDKLAQKFSAQEMIKANSQAEAEEMKRLQLQISEYEKILQEMRKLNYRNTELSEKIDQTIGGSADTIQDLREEGQKLVAALRGLMEEQEKKREAELEEREEERNLISSLRELMSEQARNRGAELEKREEEEKLLSSLRELAEEQARKQEEEQEEKEAAQNLISSLRELMGEQARNRAAELEKKDEQQILISSLRELTEEQMRSREAEQGLAVALRELMDEQSRNQEAEQHLVGALRELMDEQRRNREAELERERENEEKQRTDLSSITALLEDKFQSSEDFVHKENVKVYRNVQAVVVDELKHYTDNAQADQGRMSANLGRVMIFSAISMLASVAGVVFWVLTTLGIL